MRHQPTLDGRSIVPKVSCQAPLRAHTIGHKLPLVRGGFRKQKRHTSQKARLSERRADGLVLSSALTITRYSSDYPLRSEPCNSKNSDSSLGCSSVQRPW